MRLAIISPLEMRVPPVAYGGTELVVSLITEELVRRGHDVTLFASGDSLTKAKLVPGCPRFLRESGRDSNILTMLNVVSCLERAEEFDIIHNHTCFEGLAMAGLAKTPVLTTLHGGLSGDWLLLFEQYKGWYNTISHAAKSLLPPKEGFAGVVLNAIDCASYPFNEGGRGDYLLFLSRISHEKAPHLAIEVALQLNMRLIIAGNVHPVDARYFQSQVLPHIDGDLVCYLGEVDYHRKRELLCQAHCVLAPIIWEEPFGLFMLEAMACGTPVVVFNRGSASEVVKHGETGFVVNTLDEMAAFVMKAHEIDPQRCRDHVERHFNVFRMVDDYMAVFEHILSEYREQLVPKTPISPAKLMDRIPRSVPNPEVS